MIGKIWKNWLVVRSLHSQPFGAFYHKELLADLLHVRLCTTLCPFWRILTQEFVADSLRVRLCTTVCPFLAHFIIRIFSGFIACATVCPFYWMLKQGEVRTGDEGAGVQQEAPGPAARRRSGTAARAQETTREKGKKMHAILLISSKKGFFLCSYVHGYFEKVPKSIFCK